MVDDNRVDDDFLWLKLESELFFNSSEEGWELGVGFLAECAVGKAVGCVAKVNVVNAGEVGVVDDGSVNGHGQQSGDSFGVLAAALHGAGSREVSGGFSSFLALSGSVDLGGLKFRSRFGNDQRVAGKLAFGRVDGEVEALAEELLHHGRHTFAGPGFVTGHSGAQVVVGIKSRAAAFDLLSLVGDPDEVLESDAG